MGLQGSFSLNFVLKPPNAIIKQGLLCRSITQKAIAIFFNMEVDIFSVLIDDVFCSNGTIFVTPTYYFDFLCTISPYL